MQTQNKHTYNVCVVATEHYSALDFDQKNVRKCFPWVSLDCARVPNVVWHVRGIVNICLHSSLLRI